MERDGEAEILAYIYTHTCTQTYIYKTERGTRVGLAPTTASPRISHLLVNTDFLNSAQHTRGYFPLELQNNNCITSFSKN